MSAFAIAYLDAELDGGDDHRNKQSEAQYHEYTADIREAELGGRIFALVLLVALQIGRFLPPFVVVLLNDSFVL